MVFLSKEQKIDELVEYIVDSMSMSDLEAYSRQTLREYYISPEGQEDFDTNYTFMKESIGDD